MSVVSSNNQFYDIVNEDTILGNDNDKSSSSSRSGARSRNADEPGDSTSTRSSPATNRPVSATLTTAVTATSASATSMVVGGNNNDSLDNLIAAATGRAISKDRQSAALSGSTHTTPSPLLFGADEGGAITDGTNTDCPYCHKTYREPRILNCLHALCEDCIIAQLEGRAEPPSALHANHTWRHGNRNYRATSASNRQSLDGNDADTVATEGRRSVDASGGGSGRQSKLGALEEELEPSEVKVAKPPPGVIRCPLCKQDSQVGNDVMFVHRMLSDYVTLNRLDAASIDNRGCETCKTGDTAVARCQNCFSFLCSNCVQAHQYMRCFDGHKVVTFEEVRAAREKEGAVVLHRPIYCQTHRHQQLQYFCASCQEPVCQECTITTHQLNNNHQVQTIDQTTDDVLRQHLNKVVEVAEEKVNDSCVAQSQLESKLTELGDRVDNARTTVLEQFDIYREQLEKRKEELLAELNEQHELLERQINGTFDGIANTAQKMHDACAFARRLLSHGNTMELLVSRGRVMQQLSYVFYSMPTSSFAVSLDFVSNADTFRQAVAHYAGRFVGGVTRMAADPLATNNRLQNLPTAMPPLPMTERPAIPSSPSMGTPQTPTQSFQGPQSSVMHQPPMRMPPTNLTMQQPFNDNNAGASGDNMDNNLKLLAEALQKMGQQQISTNTACISSYMGGPPPMAATNQPPPQMMAAQQRYGAYTRNVAVQQQQGVVSDNLARMAAQMNQQQMPAAFGTQNAQQRLPFNSVVGGVFAAPTGGTSLFGGPPPPPTELNLGRQSAYPWATPTDSMAGTHASSVFSGVRSGRSSVTPVDPAPGGGGMIPASTRITAGGSASAAATSSFSFFGPPAPTQITQLQQTQTANTAVGGGLASSSSASSLGAIWNVSASPTVTSPPDVGDTSVIGGTDLPVRRTNMASMHIRKKFGQLGPAEGQFHSPHGFCLGHNEEIVVADTNNHRIQFFSKDGDFICTFGETGKEDGKLWYPRKVAMLRGSTQQRFIVCDRGNERSRMQIFNRNGQFEKKIVVHYIEMQVVLGQPPVRKQVIRYMDIVAGLAVDKEGHIVAVDSVTPTIFRINPETGELLKYFDISAHMKEPSDIAVHGNEYFVCDFKGHSVCVFNDSGAYVRKIGNDELTSFPNGIDVSDDGDVLIGDSHGNRFHVCIYKKDGSFVTEFECPYVKVSRCCGLRITTEGYVITLAKNNHHVLVLDTLYVD